MVDVNTGFDDRCCDRRFSASKFVHKYPCPLRFTACLAAHFSVTARREEFEIHRFRRRSF